MKIRIGYEIGYQSAGRTPMLLMLSVHPSRLPDLLMPHRLDFDPPIPATGYRDCYGNICTRIVAPEGRLTISADMIVTDPGTPDIVEPQAPQHPVEYLPEEALLFLLGSRYCETDRLSDIAWSLFGTVSPGWARVQAIVDFVHEHIVFGYEHARPTKTAWEAYHERCGVCRDFTHLAVTLCRCMNSPRDIAPDTSAISASRRTLRRWISAPGLKSISALAGTPSTRGTINRELAGS